MDGFEIGVTTERLRREVEEACRRLDAHLLEHEHLVVPAHSHESEDVREEEPEAEPEPKSVEDAPTAEEPEAAVEELEEEVPPPTAEHDPEVPPQRAHPIFRSL